MNLLPLLGIAIAAIAAIAFSFWELLDPLEEELPPLL